MIAYASRTGTRRTVAALRAAGWRILVSAAGKWKHEGLAYAIDRGAGADWIAVPDIVAGGASSLEFSLSWLPRLRGVAPLLLPVQDGMRVEDVTPLVGKDLGLFVGGTTRWKLDSLQQWGVVARARGCHLHVGRVNTARRIALCAAAGAESFDGTSVSRYVVNLPRLENARRQLALPY